MVPELSVYIALNDIDADYIIFFNHKSISVLCIRNESEGLETRFNITETNCCIYHQS